METNREGNGGSCKTRRPFIKCHWTTLEDNLLIKLIERFGQGNWEYIARHFQGRTGKSCRLRWMNHLNPTVKKAPFTAEEQARLLKLQKFFGNKWATIVNFFPGRTDNQVKNQYHVLVKTRSFKNAGGSTSSDHHGSVERGSVNRDSSTNPIGSKFSRIHHPESSYCGFHLSFTGIPEGKQTVSLTCNDSSFANAQDETSLVASSYNMRKIGPNSVEGVNVGNMYGYDWTRPGASMMSGACSGAKLDLFPVSQSEEGACSKSFEFIDFLGVGKSK